MDAGRLARLHAAIDRNDAESVRVIPYTPGGYVVGAPDTRRPQTDFEGVVSIVPEAIRVEGKVTNTGHNAELRSSYVTVKFSTSLLPFAIVQGDHIVLLDRGSPTFKVNSTFPSGDDRTILKLEPLASS